MQEFLWPVRVYYEDTDAGGVVYHSNYLKFMERARTEWLRHLGFEQNALLREAGVLFAVRRVELDFRGPARFDDGLRVVSRVVEIRRASLLFQQEIFRENDERLLCDGRVLVAAIDAERFRPCALPGRLVLEMTNAE